MKKRICSFAVCFLVLMSSILCSCGLDDSGVQGLDYCNNYTNDLVEINYLLHDEEFIDKYEYLSGDFYYYGGTFSTCRSLLYLKYDDETYLQAKEDYLSENEVTQPYFEYKGCKFYQNLSWLDKYSTVSTTDEALSNRFVMLFYNDELNTLGAIGYSLGGFDVFSKFDLKTNEDFAKFIEKYYLEFYNFE